MEEERTQKEEEGREGRRENITVRKEGVTDLQHPSHAGSRTN